MSNVKINAVQLGLMSFDLIVLLIERFRSKGRICIFSEVNFLLENLKQNHQLCPLSIMSISYLCPKSK